MTRDRYLRGDVCKDLREKMVFIGGPRQVGKTTLAREIIARSFRQPAYFNWDDADDRKAILKYRFSPDSDLLIFDEIHKYRYWKNLLKGIYDKKKEMHRILVTGSSRLDILRRGGDSLMGRNYHYRLHPFSLSELINAKSKIQPGHGIAIPRPNREQKEAYDLLLRFGGFPEPLFSGEEKRLRRWHNLRRERVVREDIRDIELIRDMSAIQVLVAALPERVSSLLSIHSLTEDLSVSHKTVGHWLTVLENFYYHFRIYPFTGRSLKSLKKMPKIYLWDWSEVSDNPGVRFENMVASHLLKLCHYLYDSAGYDCRLYFWRDGEGREVDFLVTLGDKPWLAVETKLTGDRVAASLRYLTRRLAVPYAFQVVDEEGVDFVQEKIRVISASRFLAALV